MLSKLITSTAAAAVGRRTAYSGYKWSTEREPWHKIAKASEIINEKAIFDALESTVEAAKDPKCVRDILTKAREHATLRHIHPDDSCRSEYVQGLNLTEAATLLNIDPSHNSPLARELYNTALDIKKRIYGRRIVLFAPLYLANYCVNSCTYCAFRGPNHDLDRCHLSLEEVKEEGRAIQRMGHKRTLILCGESPKYTFDDMLAALHTLKDLKTPPHGEFRRINVEIPALSVSDMKRLKQTGCVGTYTMFQETYHQESFKKYHPFGPKSDYEYRLQTMDRAQLGGCDDVGIGALLGLYDHRFEVLAMLQHAQHLDKTFGAGPHTISVPRIRVACGSDISHAPPHAVKDDEFRRLVSVIRCAVPYTGMILSTRESADMRRELVNLGISQISAASRVDVGSYHKGDEVKPGEKFVHKMTPREKEEQAAAQDEGQFNVNDQRSAPQVISDLLKEGFIPSWCTACYRKGRTGEAFMKIAKRGDICNYCGPNGLFTLKEYLLDYASGDTAEQKSIRQAGEALIRRELGNIADPARRDLTAQKLKEIANGTRDVYF